MYDQNAVNTKYISMKMDPKGRMPAAGMMKLGSAYHAASGMGLRIKRRERRGEERRRERRRE